MATRPTPVINLERELDQVFQAPWSEFIGYRQRLAMSLKKAGRTAEAGTVRRLAKPSVTAWIVNQLYWGHREVFDRFLEACDQVRAAEEALLTGKRGSGARDATARRDRDLDELLARGRKAAERQGGLSPTLTARLRTTLEAIGAYGSEGGRHARGRLQDDLDPPGFGALASLAAAGMRVGRSRPVRTKRETSPSPPALMLVRQPDDADRKARADLAAAQAEAARRQDAAAAAADAERRARAALAQAERKLTEAQHGLEAARQARAEAAQSLRTRERDARKATAAARSAAAALDRARRAARS
jgi:hypothetical protein